MPPLCRWTWLRLNDNIVQNLWCPKLIPVKVPLLTFFFLAGLCFFFGVFSGKIVTCFLLSCIFHRVSLGTPPVCLHSGLPQVSNDVPSGLPARDAQGSMWAASCACVVSICFPEFNSSKCSFLQPQKSKTFWFFFQSEIWEEANHQSSSPNHATEDATRLGAAGQRILAIEAQGAVGGWSLRCFIEV